jgi:hypothetical protein
MEKEAKKEGKQISTKTKHVREAACETIRYSTRSPLYLKPLPPPKNQTVPLRVSASGTNIGYWRVRSLDQWPPVVGGVVGTTG